MRFFRSLKILVFTITLFALFSPGQAGETAAQFVKKVSDKVGPGIPNQAVSEFFSPEFQEYFRLAREQDARVPKDTKPYFADYLLLAPHPDAPTSTRVINSEATDRDRPQPVIVEFAYAWKGKLTSSFSVVYVTARESTWQIVDVIHITGPGGGESVRSDFRKTFPEVQKSFPTD